MIRSDAWSTNDELRRSEKLRYRVQTEPMVIIVQINGCSGPALSLNVTIYVQDVVVERNGVEN